MSIRPDPDAYTPDDMRGSYATLNAAARAGQWPTLAEARGKVMFLMDQRPMGVVYTEEHPNLQVARVLFTNGTPGEPDAAFTEANDETPGAIDTLVCDGYLVRTRTDEDTVQARSHDIARCDAVMKSGAQILSPDYPFGKAAPSGFVVEFPVAYWHVAIPC